jgi:hypothetical protein
MLLAMNTAIGSVTSRADDLSAFIGKVSNSVYVEEPPAFRGGIVADPMGMGKILAMIALAATDLETAEHGTHSTNGDSLEKYHNGTTLIIVPPPRE